MGRDRITSAADRAQRADSMLAASHAVLRGDHVVYINGDHGAGWISKDAVLPDTGRAAELCALLADALAARAFDVACGPVRTP